MDYNGHQNTLNWHGENSGVQNNSDSDPSGDDWTQLTFNEEDLSYMFDETTPVKEYGDLSYYFTHNDNISKEPEDEREASSQVRKRRRVLQFDTHGVESSLFCEETPSTFLKSSESDDLTEEALPDAFRWGAGFSEDASASSYEGLDQLCEGWLADYFHDADMFLSSDDMNITAASDVHLDISESYDARPQPGPDAVQEQATQTSQNVAFKSKKPLNCPPSKLPSSIAYPFAFIKPCGFHGDVTLNDINQRIQTRSKEKESNAAVAFPTSAFSGKPVVGKTKIRTEGGKGSITIMRTKG